MFQITKKMITSLLFIVLVIGLTIGTEAKTNVKPDDKNKNDEIQRTPTQVFDVQKNTVSNIEFYTSNYGIFGLDVGRGIGGGRWPRASLNQYIFGGGIWFGAQKWLPNDTFPKILVEVTYNPNSGGSWMVPGRIEDGDLIDETDIKKYRTYFSTDFLTNDGSPINSADGPKWPIWDSSPNAVDTLKKDRYLGFYIPDPNARDKTNYPKGPAFISGEDIFSTYKDTDLNYYEGGIGIRQPLGYPMKLQFEQMIYSWSFGDYKDFIFIKYDIINKSTDTLWNCWMAPVMDVDIGRMPSPNAANDRVKYYDADPTLNMALQWTNVEGASGEKGYGFGYLGFDFLESPAVNICEQEIDTVINGNFGTYCLMCVDTKDTVIIVPDPTDTTGTKFIPKDTVICAKKILFNPDDETFLRKDRKVFQNNYQLGLKTFKNWSITEDINEDGARYNAMASGVRDGDNGMGDKRFMMATGPFHVLPNDTVRIVIGIILANPAVRTDADGSDEDAAELVRKDKFAQQVYDNNFRAPMAPERAIITNWTPYNCGVKIEWDNTSEISNDIYETGLDFLGYRLYRARRYDLDTFDVDQITANNQYNRGKGPLGWKQIAQWEMPNPFYKSINRAGTDQKITSMPFIDSLRVVGPVISGGQTDTFAIKVMRIAKGFILAEPQSWVQQWLAPATNGYMVPFVMMVDTALISSPWGKYFTAKVNQVDYPLFHDPFNPTSNQHYLLDEVSIGTVSLNKALLPYNPLFWRKQTITNVDTNGLPDKDLDTIYLKNTIRTININGTYTLAVDRMIPYDIRQAMKDTLHLRAVLDSVYSYIQRSLGKAKFNPLFEQSDEIRNLVIAPYMDEITNHRTFSDIGDDNRDGVIDYDANPVKTEKLINNINYYYKLLSYDEGDYSQPTPQKLNTGDLNLPNVAETVPISESAMKPMDFKVTYVDSAKIGGLYNFKMFALDADRVQQLYAGHEFELEFSPLWNFNMLQFPNTTTAKEFGIYMRNLILTDLNTGKILFNANTFFEQTPCSFPYRTLFTEDAASLVFSDQEILDTISGIPITIGVPYDNTKMIRSGKFTTGEFTQNGYCYSPAFMYDAYGTLGISFDFTMEQRGGRYRPDSTSGLVSGNSTTPITFITDIPSPIRETDKVITTQQVDFQVVRQEFRGNPNGSYGFAGYGQGVNASFNNGPAEYLVEFLSGGVETLNLSWDTPSKTKTFNVPYLNVKVTNSISYKRPAENGEVDVTYPGEIQHLFIDVDTLIDPPRLYPDPRNLRASHDEFIGKYNLSSYGFVDVRSVKGFRIARQSAVPADGPRAGMRKTFIGTQGRYYLTGYSQDGADTVDFTNMFMGSGCFFAMDYARKERRWDQAEWALTTEQKDNYGTDFAPGDKILLKTTGGALGFPLPGAKVKFRIDSAVPNLENYTDDILNQIGIAPNPYYITHQGQKSAYDAKIYFTRLPKICNIDIYTVTGDLIQSIKHDELTSSAPDKEGVDLWNLLSTNKQRVQSQILVALITTPNGAQTIKKFSVVVGGFRLVE